MPKVLLDAFSAVTIIFRESNPAEIYAEAKDSTYPWFPSRLCFIGGNYGDKVSMNDIGPCATLVREINEELCLTDSPSASYLDLRKKVTTLPEDVDMLTAIAAVIAGSIRPWMDCWQKVPGSVRKAYDPNRTGDPQDMVNICSYWLCPLNDTTWGDLLYLRAKFGRLSTESYDRPVSLDQILNEGLEWIYGHDQAAQMFFALHARRGDSCQMPIIRGIVVDPIGPPLATYDEYRTLYDFKKDPLRPPAPKT